MAQRNRRDFLKIAGTGMMLGPMARGSQAQSEAWRWPKAEDDEEAFTGLYDVDRSLVNLENAYWNVMSRPVALAYQRKIEYINRRNVAFVRSVLPGESLAEELAQVRERVARLVGVAADEIALTRCGTEALQNLILGYSRLRPGDAVLFADLDYDAMQNNMLYLKERRGVDVVTFNLPEPATTANILAAYEEVLSKTPRARLLLVTHLCHRTGLVNPVREIIALARRFGVSCILDTAQAVGQMPVKLREIDADFAGFSLHKWIGAPLGTGAIYIRREKLAEMELCFGNHEDPPESITARVYSGTYNFAAALTIPAALDFHERLTVELKQRRLQSLRNDWVERVRALPGIEILTPDDPARYGATTSFRLKGMKHFEQAQELQKTLLHKYGILTVARKGIAQGAAIRVTPALYNRQAELDRLVRAIKEEHARFA